MPLARIARIDTGPIPAGGFVDVGYDIEKKLTLKRIVAAEAGGAPLANIIATFYVNDAPLFRPDASLVLFEAWVDTPISFDIPLEEGSRIRMRITNNTTATVRVYIHLIFE